MSTTPAPKTTDAAKVAPTPPTPDDIAADAQTTGSVLADKKSPQDEINELLDLIGDARNDAWDEMMSFYGDRQKFRDLIVKIGQTAKKVVDIHDTAVKGG